MEGVFDDSVFLEILQAFLYFFIFLFFFFFLLVLLAFSFDNFENFIGHAVIAHLNNNHFKNIFNNKSLF